MTMAAVTARQVLAMELHQRLGTDTAVGQALNITRESANRLRNRGLRNLQQIRILAAAGTDPLEALSSSSFSPASAPKAAAPR